jgi:hypothetical protein
MESDVSRHGRKQNDLISAPHASLTAGEGAAAIAAWNDITILAAITDIRTRRPFGCEGVKCCSWCTWNSFDTASGWLEIARSFEGRAWRRRSSGEVRNSPRRWGDSWLARYAPNPPGYRFLKAVLVLSSTARTALAVIRHRVFREGLSCLRPHIRCDNVSICARDFESRCINASY